MRQWAIGLLLPDQCRFFAKGVLLFENTEVALEMDGNQTVHCQLTFFFQNFSQRGRQATHHNDS
jgi:hypothetical protein